MRIAFSKREARPSAQRSISVEEAGVKHGLHRTRGRLDVKARQGLEPSCGLTPVRRQAEHHVRRVRQLAEAVKQKRLNLLAFDLVLDARRRAEQGKPLARLAFAGGTGQAIVD